MSYQSPSLLDCPLTCTSIVLVALIRLIIMIQADHHQNKDISYGGTNLTHWTVIEVHTAIVVCCLMTLKPLLTKLFPAWFDVESSDNETSVLTGTAPLTIGSRPSRNPPSATKTETWAETTDRMRRELASRDTQV